MIRHYTRKQFIEDIRLLKLPKNGKFTHADIKQSRSLLLQQHHPDKGGSKEKAQLINSAYDRLEALIVRRTIARRRTSKVLQAGFGLLLVAVSGGIVAARRHSSFGLRRWTDS